MLTGPLGWEELSLALLDAGAQGVLIRGMLDGGADERRQGLSNPDGDGTAELTDVRCWEKRIATHGGAEALLEQVLREQRHPPGARSD